MEMVHFIPSSQRRLALLAAQTDSAPALICGSSGTGKGAIAGWIHSNGPRSTRVFQVAAQNKSLTDQLLEAHGGTLMIPEIGEWNLSDQKSLLSYLKTKAVLSTAEPSVPQLTNTRIIATTSHVLEGRAQGGLFNIELLEKLNVFRIEMPPLIKRMDEFDDIVVGIVGEMTKEFGKKHVRAISPEAWIQLRSYDWPGNLRELRNVLRFAVAAAKGDQIETGDLPDFGFTKIDFRSTREKFEKVYILELLKTFDWEIDKTCNMTHMNKANLLAKVKNYGISVKTTE